jgi:hypothetical protein
VDIQKIILDTVKAVPEVIPHLSNKARVYVHLHERKASQTGELSSVNKIYHDAVTRALIGYFEGGSIATSRNTFKRVAIQAFSDAFDLGWISAGGILPIDDDGMDWLQARLNLEMGNIDMLYQEAKELRRDKDFDYFSWLTARADGYTETLRFVYNSARMLVGKDMPLTWRLGNAEHCSTCTKLNGKTHRASYYLRRNYIPGMPGSSTECRGFNCACHLEDNKGAWVTI